MLCEHCKIREATVRYVEVVNGVKTEHNLCAQCAGHVDIGQYSALFDGEFPLGKFLSGLLGMADPERGGGQYAGVACPVCHTTYEEFIKNSQFGCPDCYAVFDPLIGEKIKHLQGNVKHTGKRPARYDKEHTKYARTEDAYGEGSSDGGGDSLSSDQQKTIERLKEKLSQAIRLEEFEEAAALRDEIRKLKEETKQNGKMV